jgi:hypothetical protein
MTEHSKWYVLMHGPEGDEWSFGFDSGYDPDLPATPSEALELARANVPDGGGFALYRLHKTETDR